MDSEDDYDEALCHGKAGTTPLEPFTMDGGLLRVPALVRITGAHRGDHAVTCAGCVLRREDLPKKWGECQENRCRYWTGDPKDEGNRSPVDFILIHPSRLEDYKRASVLFKLDEEEHGDGPSEPWDFRP